MKSVSDAFRTMLETTTHLVHANLYTFTLKDGTVLRWTDAQQPLTVGANTFAVGPVITRDRIRMTTGIEVSSTTMTLFGGDGISINGRTVLQAVNRGDFDDAEVSIDKFLSPSWSDTTRGSVNMFSGVVTEADADRAQATLQIKCKLQALTKQFPVNYIIPSCIHTLFDAGCTLNKADYQVSGTVGAAPTVSSFDTDLSQADDYFALGTLLFTSGVNNGIKRTIKSYASGKITLIYPLEAMPAAGDTFNCWPGCDKTQDTCNSKFNNQVNFRGFPYMPTPETIYAGAGTQAPSGGGGEPPRPPSGRGGKGQIQPR